MVNYAIQKISHKIFVSTRFQFPATSIYQQRCQDTNITIPEKYQNEATTADLIIFVGFINEPTNFVDGYGQYCLQLGSNGRPLIGKLILNVGRLKMDGSHFEKNINITTHEILHMIGYNTSLYPYFKKINDLDFSFEDENQRMFVRGANILKIAKEHFNCPTIDRIQMENGGGAAGSAKNHFEFKILGTDIMNGSAKEYSSFSYFTLAFIADSGWYI